MSDFPTFEMFFEAATGRAPYEWQRALAAEVQEHGWRPRVEVPTGLGKTSCIHISVYELARQLASGEERTAPLRIFHVIDRNSVVQQSAKDVRDLAAAINTASTPPLAVVREALASALPEQREAGPALAFAVYRGTLRDGDPQRAFGAMVTTMTAHQFISRVLFRGFGVSPKTRPIEAGLAGIDSLVLLDEPHLSQPPLTALEDIRALQSHASAHGLRPLEIVTLGATQRPVDAPDPERETLDLAEAAFEDPRTAGIRTGQRALTLSAVPTKSDTAFAKRIADLVTDTRKVSPESRIGVMVNTIAMAHAVAGLLRSKGDSPDVITSRVRPVDRRPPERSENEGVGRGSLVIATQCIEVGFDISFDHLITEACPLHTFVQRVGRLNRRGTSIGTGFLVTAESKGETLVRDGSAAVYGAEAIKETITYLRNLSEGDVIDASLEGQRAWPDPPEAVWPLAARTATITSALVPYLTLTNPPLPADIAIDAFIHGPDAEPARDIRVAWRDDLDLLDECPLLDGEFITLPIGAIRAFLGGDRRLPIGFTDDGAAVTPPTAKALTPRPDARIRDRQGRWQAGAVLAPGAVVVINTREGGYTRDGWDPTSRATVSDVSAVAALSDESNPTARSFTLSEATLRQLSADGWIDPPALTEILNRAQDIDRDDPSELQDLASLLAAGMAPQKPAPALAVIPMPDSEHLVVRIEPKVQAPKAAGMNQTLSQHLAQVSDWARADAQAVGLPDHLISAVADAGLRHDVGKSADAWQRVASQGGVRGETFDGERREAAAYVAKYTAHVPRRLWRRYSESFGLPRFWRHEALSFDMSIAQQVSALAAHLVAAHHGWFRPFAPLPAVDEFRETLTRPEQDSQRHGADHADEFDRLNREYGPWGLAYLEAVVRLADQRASQFPRNDIEPESAGQLLGMVSGPQPRAIESEDLEIELTGLPGNPTAGWFAVTGILGTAAKMGFSASACWRRLPRGSDLPVLPVVRLGCSIEAVVEYLWQSDEFTVANKLVNDHVGQDLFAKSHKVAVTGNLVRRLLHSADDSTALISGVLSDLAPAANSKLELSVASIANNSSYGRVATDALAQPSTIALSALVDEGAGYADANCDGGFDRSTAVNPFVNGLGEHGNRQSRALLAPFVLAGFAALGAPPIKGHGVADNTLTLPLPERFSSLSELRALSLIGDQNLGDWSTIECSWILRGSVVRPTEYEKYWDAMYVKRV